MDTVNSLSLDDPGVNPNENDTLLPPSEITITLNVDDSSMHAHHRQLCEGDRLLYDQRRKHALTGIKFAINERIRDQRETTFSALKFCKLFAEENVLQYLFQLFDYKSKNQLVQSDFIEFLKIKLGTDGTEFVHRVDTLCYEFANEADLNFQMFCRIWQSKKILELFFALINSDKTDHLSLNQVMAFITECTLQRRNSGSETSQLLEQVKDLPSNHQMDFEEFKTRISCKNPFFAKRVFHIFDKDGSNTISRAEFREGLEQFYCRSEEEKVQCLFQIYDQNEDGLIQKEELRAVLKACTEENNLEFSEMQLDQLTIALYEDAQESVNSVGNLIHSPKSGLSYKELRAQMAKHPGLLENLSISLVRSILPTRNKPKKTLLTLAGFVSYLKNNVPYIVFVTAFAIVNFGLFVVRAIEIYFNNEENIFYSLARASGHTLNFNCAFILVLMLRHCITILRQIGCASFLPLDQNVYLHIMCGVVVASLSALHTVTHLINFPMNIAEKHVTNATGTTHSTVEWLFTMNPGMFGLVPGLANLTGWALVIILAVMVVCSLPIVRRSGFFEVFYWTHLLHYPFWILLILHGPSFWKWFIAPAVLYILVETIPKIRLRWTHEGRTFIESAVLLPSSVIHLIIRKPQNFHYHPGDYVFVKIPAIASSEWHPFTISSAPELQDYIWLHIHASGGWTKKLCQYFEQQHAQKCIKSTRSSSPSHIEEPNCQHCQHIVSRPVHLLSQQEQFTHNDFRSCRQSLEPNMVAVDLSGISSRNSLSQMSDTSFVQ